MNKKNNGDNKLITQKDDTSGVKRFKENMDRLEDITRLLESGNLELEEVLSLYEEGIELTNRCMDTLSKAELKITEIDAKLASS